MRGFMISLEDKIEILKGDITECAVDAIVNAANTELLLGSGVAGAIRKNGGASIQSECDGLGPIPLGEAVVTGAGNLAAKFVIHAAGMHSGGRVSTESLENSTRNSLLRAQENGVKTIAFPAIGTGVGGYPAKSCAELMIDIVSWYINNEGTSVEKVYFVLFGDSTYEVFKDTLQRKLIKRI